MSLPYVLRAVSAVLAIAFGAQAIFPPGQSYIVQTEELVLIAAAVITIGCGCIALIRPWNILVPLWTFYFGMVLISDGSLFKTWRVLSQVWRYLLRLDLESVLLVALFAIAFAFSVAAWLMERSPDRYYSNVDFRIIVAISILSLCNAVFLAHDTTWLANDLGVESSAAYLSEILFRIVIAVAFIPALIAFVRGQSYFVVALITFMSAASFEGFDIVFNALRWEVPFDTTYPHSLRIVADYVPDAVVLVGNLAGLALIAFATRQSRASATTQA